METSTNVVRLRQPDQIDDSPDRAAARWRSPSTHSSHDPLTWNGHVDILYLAGWLSALEQTRAPRP